MVQYSAPARPVMMRRTASEALQSGPVESVGVACRVCSGETSESRPAIARPDVALLLLTDWRTAACRDRYELSRPPLRPPGPTRRNPLRGSETPGHRSPPAPDRPVESWRAIA